MAEQDRVERVAIRNSDGDVTEVATLRNGVLDGETLVYAAGRVAAILQFSDGKQSGPAVFYDDAGQILVRALYRDGKLHGDSLYFDAASGVVMRKAAYERGVLHGYTVDFYPSGKPREVALYQNNLKEGEHVRLSEAGKITARTYFRQGKPAPRPQPVPKTKIKPISIGRANTER